MDMVLAFVTGFFSSLHCVGMCGAIVLAISGGSTAIAASTSKQAPISSLVPPQLSYHCGRILGYAILGAVGGLLGGFLSGLSRIGTFVSVVSGGLMVAMGVALLVRPATSMLPLLVRKVGQRWFARLVRLGGVEGGFYIGLLTPLLPCGLLYSMLVRSMSSSSPLEGALIMAAFGCGAVPALLATGLLAGLIPKGIRAAGNMIASFLVIALGFLLVARGLGWSLPWLPWLH